MLLLATIVIIVGVIGDKPLPKYSQLSKSSPKTLPSKNVYDPFEKWANRLITAKNIQNMDALQSQIIEPEMTQTTAAWDTIMKRIFVEFFQSVKDIFPFDSDYYAIITRCGSFGRNELLPTSDIDLCCVYIDKQIHTRKVNTLQELIQLQRKYIDEELLKLFHLGRDKFKGFDKADFVFKPRPHNKADPLYGAANVDEFFESYFTNKAKTNDIDTDGRLLAFLDAQLLIQWPPHKKILFQPFFNAILSRLLSAEAIFHDFTVNVISSVAERKRKHSGKNAKYAIMHPLTLFTSVVYLKCFKLKHAKNYNSYHTEVYVGDENLKPVTLDRLMRLVEWGIIDEKTEQHAYQVFLETGNLIYIKSVKVNVGNPVEEQKFIKSGGDISSIDFNHVELEFYHGLDIEFDAVEEKEVDIYIHRLAEGSMTLEKKNVFLLPAPEYDNYWINFWHLISIFLIMILVMMIYILICCMLSVLVAIMSYCIINDNPSIKKTETCQLSV